MPTKRTPPRVVSIDDIANMTEAQVNELLQRAVKSKRQISIDITPAVRRRLKRDVA